VTLGFAGRVACLGAVAGASSNLPMSPVTSELPARFGLTQYARDESRVTCSTNWEMIPLLTFCAFIPSAGLFRVAPGNVAKHGGFLGF
jgi:hypothetical protein